MDNSVDEQVEKLLTGTRYFEDSEKNASKLEDVKNELRARLIQRQEEGRPLRVYCGYDPTATDLHLGHTITMRKLRQFQDCGHDVIFLVGTFTSLIGDPSDKDKARDGLELAVAETNARTYAEQAFKILDRKRTTVLSNHEWWSEMTVLRFLELADSFRLEEYSEDPAFEKRERGPLSLTVKEASYAVLQGYDAVALAADAQVGGPDQEFNISAGGELQKKFGQEPQIAIIMGEMLLGKAQDGIVEKMSKSRGNHIPLLSAPWDMFSDVMSLPDAVLDNYHKLILGYTQAQADALIADLLSGKRDPKAVKENLAYEIVKTFHDENHADKARRRWEAERITGGAHGS